MKPGFVYFNDLLPLKCYWIAGWGRTLLAWLSNQLSVSIDCKCVAHSQCMGGCDLTRVKTGTREEDLPQTQCLAVLAEFCVPAIAMCFSLFSFNTALKVSDQRTLRSYQTPKPSGFSLLLLFSQQGIKNVLISHSKHDGEEVEMYL